MERDQATKFMYDLLKLMLSKKGSDLFITAGLAGCARRAADSSR